MSQNSGSCRIDFEQKTENLLERGKNRHNFALFSFGFVFTACSADDDLSNENPLDNNQVIVAGKTFGDAVTRGFLSDIYNAVKKAVTFIKNVRKNGLTMSV